MTRISLFLLVILLALAACGDQAGQSAAGVPTATLAPIVSMTPRFTATPVPSRTPLPTDTFTPSPTPLSPTPSDTPTPSPTPPITGIVASLQTVNVREGPGINFGIIAALVPGTGVRLLGQNEDGRWLNIQMENGTEGWMAASLVRINPTPTLFPTATPSPDLTALALGTPLPTAVLGGGTITPTPPRSVISPTPVGIEAASPTPDVTVTLVIPVIDVTAIQLTAAALNGGTPLAATLPPPVSPGALPATPAPAGTATFTPVPIVTGTAPAGVGAQGNTGTQQGVDVLAYCDNPLFGKPAPTNLIAGATIDVFWSWYVSDPELIQQHLDNVIYEVRVNGTLLQNWRQYTGNVVKQGDGNYYIYWFVPFGPLQPGEYRITYQVSWRAAITDGYDNFGPGTNKPTESGTCAFTVR